MPQLRAYTIIDATGGYNMGAIATTLQYNVVAECVSKISNMTVRTTDKLKLSLIFDLIKHRDDEARMLDDDWKVIC